jgi:hypothetical protein
MGESEAWGHKIDERRNGLQFESWKIAVAGKITRLQMTADAKPVAGGLQRKMNVLAGF